MIGKMQAAQILTETVLETIPYPAEVSQEQKQYSTDSAGMTSVSGIGTMLGRRLSRKQPTESQEGKPKARSTLMAFNHEVLKVTTSVPPADLEMPAGLKEKK